MECTGRQKAKQCDPFPQAQAQSRHSLVSCSLLVHTCGSTGWISRRNPFDTEPSPAGHPTLCHSTSSRTPVANGPGRQSTKTGKRGASLCSKSAVGCRSQETTQIGYIWSPPPTVAKGKQIQSTLGEKAGGDGMNMGTMSRVRQAEYLVSNRRDRKKGTHSLQSYVEPGNPDLPVDP